MRRFFLIALCFFCLPAFDCTPDFNEHIEIETTDEFIARSDNIVLARVVSARTIDKKTDTNRSHALYTLEPIEVIKGTAPSPFTIEGLIQRATPAPLSYNQNYDDHSCNYFWKDSVGMTEEDKNCELQPTMNLGSTYLVFVDKPYHEKSFELILDTKSDKWLQYIRNKAGKG